MPQCTRAWSGSRSAHARLPLPPHAGRVGSQPRRAEARAIACPRSSITSSVATRSPWLPAASWPSTASTRPPSCASPAQAGYTTGMVAHYFDTKQEIIVAALRLILRRIEERLTPRVGRRCHRTCSRCSPRLCRWTRHAIIECAFWIAFWGQVPADKRLKRSTPGCTRSTCGCSSAASRAGWPEWSRWPRTIREQTLRSLMTFINGITASTVASRADWPAERQIGQLRLQLELLHGWAVSGAGRRLSRHEGCSR